MRHLYQSLVLLFAILVAALPDCDKGCDFEVCLAQEGLSIVSCHAQICTSENSKCKTCPFCVMRDLPAEPTIEDNHDMASTSDIARSSSTESLPVELGAVEASHACYRDCYDKDGKLQCLTTMCKLCKDCGGRRQGLEARTPQDTVPFTKSCVNPKVCGVMYGRCADAYCRQQFCLLTECMGCSVCLARDQ